MIPNISSQLDGKQRVRSLNQWEIKKEQIWLSFYFYCVLEEYFISFSIRKESNEILLPGKNS